MTKEKYLYDVWTDGSYRSESTVGGAAWLIVHQDAKTTGSSEIPKLEKTAKAHGSDIAELTAVSGALRSIPPNSSVHLRLDAQNIIDWLKAGRIGAKSEIPPLQQAFDQALKGMQKMSHVEITKVSGKRNENLTLVNDLARKASGLAARAQTHS